MSRTGRRLLVLGGGFYGAAIAAHRAAAGDNVVLLEARKDLMTAASTFNQARVHGGYHYPRALTTAARSQAHYRWFLSSYASCVVDDFVSLYAIARGSKTTARKFRRMCEYIGAPLWPASPAVRRLFSAQTIDDVWIVREAAFDATLLRARMREELDHTGVDLRLSTPVLELVEAPTHVLARTADGSEHVADGALVAFYGESSAALPTDVDLPGLQFEPCEMALVRVPDTLEGVGITVMDGPFFSLWPFPMTATHSLSHVRYTPHGSHARFEQALAGVHAGLTSRADRMLRDAARYVPALADAMVQESLWGVKAVPARRELDDGRPILVKRSARGRVLSLLGSKFDNVADALVVSDRHSDGLVTGSAAGGGLHG